MVAMIIYRLEIENFYSVRERQAIDLTVRGEVPSDQKMAVEIDKNSNTWVPRVVALFGPNASGKTNVLRAISFINHFMKASAFGPQSNLFGYYKFGTPKEKKLPTRLSISFASNHNYLSKKSHFMSENGPIHKYCYEIEFSGMDENKLQRVTRESLKCLSGGADKETCIFERDEIGKVKIYEKISSYEKRKTLEEILRSDASVISTLWILRDEFTINLVLNLVPIYTNLLIDRNDSPENYVKRYHEDKELLDSLNFDLERFDFGVSGVEVFDGINGPSVWFSHDGLSEGVIIDLESQGTKRFIAIYPILKDALNNGGVAVVDEFDISLHPLILPEIFRWFEDRETNPHGAQLWITCHSITLMRNLMREGIVICDKNRKGSSSVYSLGSVKDVKSHEDFMEGYIRGVFGGVPVIG